jgi:Surface-adhesin protein E
MRTALAIMIVGVAGGAFAAGPDWQSIGENANGNRIYVDKSSIRNAPGGAKAVDFRTEMKTPIETLRGGITSMRSQMRVNCADMTAAGIEVVLFEDEAKDLAFARNKATKIEYVKEPAGSSADLVISYVCKK